MIKTQEQHDVQRTLTNLREHLARHDRPVAFLFGAGTSSAVRVPASEDPGEKPLIPGIAKLTQLCRSRVGALGEDYVAAWNAIERQCVQDGVPSSIESILSRLRMMLHAMSEEDTLVGLSRSKIGTMEESVRTTIAQVVSPEISSIPSDFHHRKFARWLARTERQHAIEIFTVNYDVLIEHALEMERVPVFDGFVGSFRPFFHPDSLRSLEAAPGKGWARLWKMHGSVTWRRVDEDGRRRIVRGEPNPDGEMILPSFEKYDESRQQPYVAFADRLSRFLEQDDALLIVAGFSFSDEHINNLIFGALEGRPRTHVYALQFDDLSTYGDLGEWARRLSNLIVLGPTSGVIGGRLATWSSMEGAPFTEGLLDTSFASSDRQSEAAEVVQPETALKIGDFAVLCEFLNSMTRE